MGREGWMERELKMPNNRQIKPKKRIWRRCESTARRCESTARHCESAARHCDSTARRCESTARHCHSTARRCHSTARRCDSTARHCESTARCYRSSARGCRRSKHVENQKNSLCFMGFEGFLMGKEGMGWRRNDGIKDYILSLFIFFNNKIEVVIIWIKI